MTDRDYQELAESVVEYIGAVQPQLDRIESLKKDAAASVSARTALAKFAKRASETVEKLASSGLVAPGDVQPLIERVSGDPSLAWDLVEKVAKAVEPPDIGRRSEQQASTAPQDPWLREFGGYNNGATGVIY